MVVVVVVVVVLLLLLLVLLLLLLLVSWWWWWWCMNSPFRCMAAAASFWRCSKSGGANPVDDNYAVCINQQQLVFLHALDPHQIVWHTSVVYHLDS